jgi:hypothetical protein
MNLSIQCPMGGGAPGPTAAATKLVEAWSPGIRHLVYDHMSNVWVHRLSPTLFKAKVMKLAPRIAGNSELKNMRPISLYEIMRKVCTATVSKRISAVGLNYEVLYPDQYGYVLPQLLHSLSKIPAAMQDGLRRVCAVKVPDYVEADVKAAIKDPITFQDFNESLNAISNGGAPGPSDATVKLVKAWAPETRQLVYDLMSNIWVHRTTPKWLKTRSLNWHRRLLATLSRTTRGPSVCMKLCEKHGRQIYQNESTLSGTITRCSTLANMATD